MKARLRHAEVAKRPTARPATRRPQIAIRGLSASRDAADSYEFRKATLYELLTVGPTDLDRGPRLDEATIVDEAVAFAHPNLPSLEMGKPGPGESARSAAAGIESQAMHLSKG
jgi:hypothetical protein